MKKQSIIFSLRIIGLALAFYSTVLVTNSVSASVFGAYSYVLAIAIPVGQFSTLGLHNWLIKEFGEYNELRACFIPLSKLVFLSSSILGLCLCFIIIHNSENPITLLTTNLFVVWVSVIVYSLSLTIIPFYQALHQADKGLLIFNVGQPLVFMLAFKILDLKLLESFAFSYSLVFVIFYFREFRDKIGRPTLQINFENLSWDRIRSYGFANLTSILFVSSPMIVGASLLQLNELAYFTIIVKLCSILSLYMMIFNYTLVPRFAGQIRNSDYVGLFKSYRTSVVYCIGFSVLALAFFYSFSKDIFVIFGSDYDNVDTTVFFIYLSGAVINLVFGPTGALLMMAGKTKSISIANVISFTAYLTLLVSTELIYVCIAVTISVLFKNILLFALSIQLIMKETD